MPNMGYCRFHNTLSDLYDCIEHLEDDDLSAEEAEKRFHLLEAMVETVDQYNLMDEDELDSFYPGSDNYRYKDSEEEDEND